MTEQKRVRCAIYTRKSSEEGLDQSFNSLHAQREACEAYVLSQKHEGWEIVATEYDDGGYSGGNMERPGLKSLLADIAAKRVVEQKVWDQVQQRLADNAPNRRRRGSKQDPAILTGLLFDGEGNRFTPSHTLKKGRRYRYYVSQAAIQRGKKTGASPLRLPAREIEGIVQSEIAHLVRSPERFAECISDKSHEPSVMADVERVLSGRDMARDAVSAIIFRNINRIVVEERDVTISISRTVLCEGIGIPGTDCADASKDIVCGTTLKRVGMEMCFEVPADRPQKARQLPALIEAIVKARDWLDRILRGEAANQRELAKQTGHDERYVSKILPLAFLPPNILEAVLEGLQPAQWSLDTLLAKVELRWCEQRVILGP